jgi:Asp-tRNA(Asn)/Glu-tRNA(Gln) amidotransferase A subunit family amidase
VTPDLTRSSAADLAGALSRKDVSAVEATQAHLDRIAAVDGDVHAFLHVDTEGALAAARDVDRRRAAGEELSPLAGVPIAVKDIAVTKGVPTTCGSRTLEGWIPPYDATVVARLRAAGLPILGKTNMDEFAMGSSTEHSAFGPTHNPWDLERIPGGSGGGSSAAVASFQAPLAIGTDTGGSIRQPAAVTGTVGTKPTYGGVSRYGLVALASSLDQAGPCSRSVLDAALLHAVIAGHDVMDSTSIDAPVPPVVEAARRADVRGLRVGPDGVGSPSAEQVMAASRDAGFGDEVKRRIILGTYALSSGYYDAYYGQAQKVRTLIARDFAAAFEQADVLVSPTAPTTAFRIGEKLDDPMAMYLNDIATIPANLAGIPGMSLPSGLADEDGLPAGIQLLAPATKDERLYGVGAALEAALEQRWGGRLLDRAPELDGSAASATEARA